MKGSYIGTMFAGFAIAAAGCVSDPTANLRGGPVSLSVTPNIMFIDHGATQSLSVVARDAELNPVDFTPVIAEAADPTVATVVFDRILPNNTTSVFNVTGVGASTTTTYIRVHGGNLKDSTLVTIN